MTGDQFDLLTELLRGSPASAANQAARAVLVEGLSQADAMRAFGITRSTVSDAVRRYSAADEKIRKAYAQVKAQKVIV